jgi:hypothetical protein
MMLMYGQVRVLGARRKPFRLDFLIYYKRDGQRGQWIYMELDGWQHLYTPAQDEERAEGIGIPELRYDNEMTRRSDFFDILLQDLRDKAVVAANWIEEDLAKADKLRGRLLRKNEARRLAA